MTYIHAIILGALQGLSELFPVSSLGHSVLIPHILGWQIDESSNFFLIFLVATHLATSLVLFGFFWKDWFKIIGGMFETVKTGKILKENIYGKIGWLLVVATIPAGIIGLLFEKRLKHIFANPLSIAVFLTLNGALLLFIEYIYRKKAGSEKESMEKISELSFWKGIKIGLWQCLALLPGFSRTGATIGGSLVEGQDHINAAHFSFLLATPIIFAAAVLKIPQLFKFATYTDIGMIVVGTICSTVSAYFSVKFLSKYFKNNNLKPFGYYCFVIGLLCIVFFTI